MSGAGNRSTVLPPITAPYRAPYPDEVVAGVFSRRGHPGRDRGPGDRLRHRPAERAPGQGGGRAGSRRTRRQPGQHRASQSLPILQCARGGECLRGLASPGHAVRHRRLGQRVPLARPAGTVRQVRASPQAWGSLAIVHAHHVRGGTPGFLEDTQPYYPKCGLSNDPFFQPPASADAPVTYPELEAQPQFRSARRPDRRQVRRLGGKELRLRSDHGQDVTRSRANGRYDAAHPGDRVLTVTRCRIRPSSGGLIWRTAKRQRPSDR